MRCTQGERGQFVKGISIQSPVAPKCIPESVKTAHWAGLTKKLVFFQPFLHVDSSLPKLIDLSYFLFVIYMIHDDSCRGPQVEV